MLTKKIQEFLSKDQFDTPFLVVDLDIVAKNYQKLVDQLPGVDVFYAVKANPAIPVLELLRDFDSNFDTASIQEIELCLKLGVSPECLSFGHTVKKERDILRAFNLGVKTFAFDSLPELEKIARAAPSTNVFCRFLTPNDGADWPLTDKFGCSPDIAADLLCQAVGLGLNPLGVSFHIGSQQKKPSNWSIALEKARRIFDVTSERGVNLSFLNLGGGFPSQYRVPSCNIEQHTEEIKKGMKKLFDDKVIRAVIEPGRFIVGDAGIIQSEVVLVSQKKYSDHKRWVYLDIGKFGGLPEVLNEAIQYEIKTPYDNEKVGPVVIAGPTCDEVDILYDHSGYQLPLKLSIGDKIEILSAGAYSASYSSVGFNGFPPLKEYYI